MKSTSKKYRKSITGITSGALRKLEGYSWPGNIRELQHAIERAVIMSDTNRLTEDDFVFSNLGNSNEVELETYNLDDVEQTIITKVIKKNKGNISHAAKELGLTRTSLYRRLEKYGL